MKRILVIVASVLLMSSCTVPTVTRIQTGFGPDLSGYWNSRDIQIVCESLIEDCLINPRITQVLREFGNRKPTVVVGRFRNESSEQINTEIITSIMETAIFNSGRLDFVAPQGLRQELYDERAYQSASGHVSDSTAARIGMEIGADFIMTGSIRTVIDRDGNTTVRTYYVTAELTNIETGARVWIGQNSDITKVITRPANRF